MNIEERKLWLEARKKGIGASEVAAILGLSPWSSPIQVWARKKGFAEEPADNLRFKVGRKLEGPIAELYAERCKVQLEKPNPALLIHPDVPLVGTPDRFVVNQDIGVEIKTADVSQAHLWGEDGTDQIPQFYLTQVAAYLALTGWEAWDVAVLIGLSDFRVFRIVRDIEVQEYILESVKIWWDRFIVGGEEPPLDGSEETSEFLLRKYPRNAKPLDVANPEEEVALIQLFRYLNEYNKAADDLEYAKNMVRQLIGDREGILGEVGKALWKNTKDSQIVDWKGLAENLLPGDPAQRKSLVEAFTSTRPGVRRFTSYPAKNGR